MVSGPLRRVSCPLLTPLVTGEHAFIAPDFAKGDKRGPCPGMNSLANHGYIHRNGLATVSGQVTADIGTLGLT